MTVLQILQKLIRTMKAQDSASLTITFDPDLAPKRARTWLVLLQLERAGSIWRQRCLGATLEEALYQAHVMLECSDWADPAPDPEPAKS